MYFYLNPEKGRLGGTVRGAGNCEMKQKWGITRSNIEYSWSPGGLGGRGLSLPVNSPKPPSYLMNQVLWPSEFTGATCSDLPRATWLLRVREKSLEVPAESTSSSKKLQQWPYDWDINSLRKCQHWLFCCSVEHMVSCWLRSHIYHFICLNFRLYLLRPQFCELRELLIVLNNSIK